MTEMLEIPTKAEERKPKLDPRLAEVVRIIVEDFGGDVRAFLASIRPKAEEPNQTAQRRERHLVELAAKGG